MRPPVASSPQQGIFLRVKGAEKACFTPIKSTASSSRKFPPPLAFKEVSSSPPLLEPVGVTPPLTAYCLPSFSSS